MIDNLINSMTFEFDVTTEQKVALIKLYLKGGVTESFWDWIKTVQAGRDYLMVGWCGMFIGIEKDGYTHS